MNMYKDEFRQKAWKLPASDLLYVGRSTNQKLLKIGIKTIGDLARMDEHILVKAMEKAAQLDMPISLHEEDPEFIIRPGVNQGKVSEELGYGGASRTAEDVMVARDCVLALHTGAENTMMVS